MEPVNESGAARWTGEPPILSLMVGLPGSGKTHRAKELAREGGALRLTPDE